MEITDKSKVIPHTCGPCGYPPGDTGIEAAELNRKIEYNCFSICEDCPYPECREAREKEWHKSRMEYDRKQWLKKGMPNARLG
jgi:hypothetical protein